MSRKPIETMSPEEMRERLLQQARTARKRGLGYRKKQAAEGRVRFSCFVPKSLKGSVIRAVQTVLEQHRLSTGISQETYELDLQAAVP